MQLLKIKFLRESKAPYDNLYPSRIIVGFDEESRKKVEIFISLLEQGTIKENIEILYIGCTETGAVKLFANTYLALHVSYFNEVSKFVCHWMVCDISKTNAWVKDCLRDCYSVCVDIMTKVESGRLVVDFQVSYSWMII